MLRLLVISVLILNITAELFSPDTFYDDNSILYSEKVNYKRKEFVNRGSPLWVVSLSGNDWLAPKLKLGNTKELEDFFRYVAPMIRNSPRRPPVRVKKNYPERATTECPQKSNKDIRNDFIKLINKFALSTTIVPEAYLSDNNYHDSKDPIISLFFKGSYSSLMVALGKHRWTYFIDEPSILPSWFFESHDTRNNPITLPEDVATQLFESLWNLLYVAFGFPN